MGKEKKNYILLIIGILVLVLGIVLLVIGIQQQVKANAVYQEEYATWHKNWWEYHTATLEDMPKRPGLPITLILGPIGVAFGATLTIGGILLLVGKGAVKVFKENAETTTSFFSNINNVDKPKNRVCKYCGSENKPDAIKCSSCGANLSDKK